MLPGWISIHRSGLNINLNYGNRITLNSSGNINISGGNVSLKYFYHDEGDFGEEVAKKVAIDNNLGTDVSSMFQSGRNGIDGAFLTKGPPPKLTMIESKASHKGKYDYSSQQVKGGKQYFNDMVNSKDTRYANFKKAIKKLEKENPGLVYDYISVETKIKITEVGFGVDEINIKDWTKPID